MTGIAPAAAYVSSHGATGDDFAGKPHRYRYFTVPTTATTGSGLVTLTVGTNAAVNTDTRRQNTISTTNIRARKIQPWNIERSPGREGSDLWDDFTQAHIWQSSADTSTTVPASDRGTFWVGSGTNGLFNVSFPSMSINPQSGVLWANQNEHGGGSSANTGTVKISSNAAADTLTTVAQFVDSIFHPHIYVNTAGDRFSAFSIIGRNSTGNNWADLGGVYIYGPGGVNPGLQAGLGGNTTHYLAESTYYNASTNAPGVNFSTTDQFDYPHVITHIVGTTEHIHTSYYDNKDGSIKYRYNRRGIPGTVNSTSAVYAWTNLDGGVDEDDQVQLTANNAAGGYLAAPFTTVAANGRIVGYTSSLAATRTARGNIDAGFSVVFPVFSTPEYARPHVRYVHPKAY
jgi:hypothetical protein